MPQRPPCVEERRAVTGDKFGKKCFLLRLVIARARFQDCGSLRLLKETSFIVHFPIDMGTGERFFVGSEDHRATTGSGKRIRSTPQVTQKVLDPGAL